MKKYRRPLLTYRNKSILNTVQVRQNIELANDISIPYYVNLQSKCIIQIILRVLNRLLTNFETCSMQSQLIIFYRTSSCVLILTFKSKIWSFRTKGDIQKERQTEPDRDRRDIERPVHMQEERSREVENETLILRCFLLFLLYIIQFQFSSLLTNTKKDIFNERTQNSSLGLIS